ncbi:unnamed protein product, partial [marine sediment metagenome]
GLIMIQLAVMARAVLRPHRDPASRIAWVVVIAAVPVLGVIAYILFGETNIGRKRVDRAREVLASLPPMASTPFENEADSRPDLQERW